MSSEARPLLSDLLTQVSAPGFGLDAFALSSEQQVLRALANEPLLRGLALEIRESPGKVIEVVRHASVLVADRGDFSYRHPHDSALVALLLALHMAGDIGVRPLVDRIAATPNAWFSRKLALWLQEHVPASVEKEIDMWRLAPSRIVAASPSWSVRHGQQRLGHWDYRVEQRGAYRVVRAAAKSNGRTTVKNGRSGIRTDSPVRKTSVA